MYIVSQYYLNVYEWRTEWNDEVTEKKTLNFLLTFLQWQKDFKVIFAIFSQTLPLLSPSLT